MSRATSCTLSARFPDSESTLKRPLIRLSVRVPVAKLHVRYQHAFGTLIQDLFARLSGRCTRKRTQCRELRDVS